MQITLLSSPSPPALRACACASLKLRDLHVENWKNALVFTGPRELRHRALLPIYSKLDKMSE